MASKDNNKKLPETDHKETYPWCQATQYLCGHEEIWNNTPDHESIRQLHAFGTFKEWGPDGAERKLVPKTRHKIVAQGQSTSVEGPHDVLNVATFRHSTHNDHYGEVGGHIVSASYQSAVHVAKGDFHHITPKTIISTQDDLVHHIGDDENETSHHMYNAGDHTQFTGKNHYHYVDGEHGTYLPKGNMDIQLDKGKYRAKSGDDMAFISDKKINTTSTKDTTLQSKAKFDVISKENIGVTGEADIKIDAKGDVKVNGKNITITADTKVTIKVGQSKIEISSSGITIDASQVDIKGHPTKINGGGMSSPPVTYP